jgi:hypothetical protein
MILEVKHRLQCECCDDVAHPIAPPRVGALSPD